MRPCAQGAAGAPPQGDNRPATVARIRPDVFSFVQPLDGFYAVPTGAGGNESRLGRVTTRDSRLVSCLASH